MDSDKTQKSERLTIDLKGLRRRLERQATEPGQSIGSIIRMVLVVGLEVLEAGQQPKQSPEAPSIASQIEKASLSDVSKKSGISEGRLIVLAGGAEPELHELSLLEPALGVSLEQLYEVYKRDFPGGKKTNGVRSNGTI